MIEDNDGIFHAATLVDTPMYDPTSEIARGKIVDIPQRAPQAAK